jgi:hypothetical protein
MHNFAFLMARLVEGRRNTGILEAGADHEHSVVVHAGFDMSNLNALSTLKRSVAT